MSKKIVFVSVGTSALECRDDTDATGRRGQWRGKPGYEKLVKTLSDEEGRDSDVEFEHQRTAILEKLKRLKANFLSSYEKPYSDLTAELASLKAMENAHDDEGKKTIGEFTGEDQLYLLCTDTTEGRLCAEVCQETLDGFIAISKAQREIVKVQGLQVDDAHLFVTVGIPELRKAIQQRLGDGNAIKYFNITGGFKGMIPYFTMIVWENRPMRLVYLFENARQIFNQPADLLVGTKPPNGNDKGVDDL